MIHALALLAKAGSGKTTIARYLQETYGVRVVSLATPLKKTAQAVMGFSDAQLFGTQAEKEATDLYARDARGQSFSARTFLQRMGTEGLRENFSQNIHLDALVKTMRADSGDDDDDDDAVFVVDDCRFPNEIRYLLALEEESSYVVKLVCTDAPSTAGNHSSETGIDAVPAEDIDATVTSSRALGVEDLIAKFEFALSARLAPLKEALMASARRRAKAA